MLQSVQVTKRRRHGNGPASALGGDGGAGSSASGGEGDRGQGHCHPDLGPTGRLSALPPLSLQYLLLGLPCDSSPSTPEPTLPETSTWPHRSGAPGGVTAPGGCPLRATLHLHPPKHHLSAPLPWSVLAHPGTSDVTSCPACPLWPGSKGVAPEHWGTLSAHLLRADGQWMPLRPPRVTCERPLELQVQRKDLLLA